MALSPTPSELRVTSVSLDSRFADQTYGSTADFMIRLPAAMRNVGRVALTSVEVPQAAYVFSDKAGNTHFTVDASGTWIPEGNYTAEQLAVAVTDLLVDVSGTCQYDYITNRYSFLTGSWGPYTVTFPAGRSLGYLLGFRGVLQLDGTMVVSVTTTVTGTQSPQIRAPAYMFLQLQCPDMVETTLHRLADGSFLQAMAKLVLWPGYFDYGFYQVQYDDGGNGVRKEVVFVRPTSVTQLRLRLVDAYGATVEMGDTDWSATLEFTEVVSAREYNALNRAMPGPGPR